MSRNKSLAPLFSILSNLEDLGKKKTNSSSDICLNNNQIKKKTSAEVLREKISQKGPPKALPPSRVDCARRSRGSQACASQNTGSLQKVLDALEAGAEAPAERRRREICFFRRCRVRFASSRGKGRGNPRVAKRPRKVEPTKKGCPIFFLPSLGCCSDFWGRSSEIEVEWGAL